MVNGVGRRLFKCDDDDDDGNSIVLPLCMAMMVLRTNIQKIETEPIPQQI